MPRRESTRTPAPRGRGGSTTTRGSTSAQRSRGSTSAQSSRGSTSGRRSRRSKQVVISLDVTYSSDELEMSSSSPEPEVQPDPLINQSRTMTRKEGRGIMSDSDSDLEVSSMPTYTEPPSAKRAKLESQNLSIDEVDDDEEDDLFAVDIKSYSRMAVQDAMKDLKAYDKDKIEQSTPSSSSSKPKEDILVLPGSDDDMENNKENDSIVTESSPLDDSLLFGSPVELKPLPKRKQLKSSAATKKVLNALKALEQEIGNQSEVNDSLDQSDIRVVSDEEDDVDTEINLRIRWGAEYFRLPIKKMQKFSVAYQNLAEKFHVAVSQIVLSHHDKMISPEVSPQDIGLTVGDILEGGICAESQSGDMQGKEESAPGSIRLKIQNANKKGEVIVHINRYDKMQLLMSKYAKIKDIDVLKLRFHFDGEKLDPGETPDTLDLDGDECIDVYHL